MTDIEQLSNKQDTLCCEKEEEAHFSFTFNIEILRVYGYLYFVTLFMIAIIITATEVNFPGGSPQYTEMYKMFVRDPLCVLVVVCVLTLRMYTELMFAKINQVSTCRIKIQKF
jgi:hypothetical protein